MWKWGLSKAGWIAWPVYYRKSNQCAYGFFWPEKMTVSWNWYVNCVVLDLEGVPQWLEGGWGFYWKVMHSESKVWVMYKKSVFEGTSQGLTNHLAFLPEDELPIVQATECPCRSRSPAQREGGVPRAGSCAALHAGLCPVLGRVSASQETRRIWGDGPASKCRNNEFIHLHVWDRETAAWCFLMVDWLSLWKVCN